MGEWGKLGQRDGETEGHRDGGKEGKREWENG